MISQLRAEQAVAITGQPDSRRTPCSGTVMALPPSGTVAVDGLRADALIFVGRTFHSAPCGHSDYWDDNNPAREIISYITIGQYDKLAR